MDRPIGLTAAEAARRLVADGPNSVGSAAQYMMAKALLKQFTSPVVIILFIATAIAMLTGDVTDGVIILAIIIPSGLLGFWQEHRASTTMQELLQQLKVTVDVIRDGREGNIAIEDIVVGDIVSLRAGDVVPADSRIVQSQRLMADESALTGESMPVEKSVASDSQLYFGTHIVSGSSLAEVVATGRHTKFGHLVAELNQVDLETNFERGTRNFSLMLARVMGILVALIFLVNVLLQRPILDSLLFSLALAVGLTPQMLPVIISVSLAAGARRMAKQDVLIKRLDAIEDFGSITALCTDKTGTLTVGAVALVDAIDVSGKSSAEVMRLAFLNAALQQGFHNPLDAAIIARTVGMSLNGVTAVAELPYDFERRRISILTSDGVQITKGAFREVSEICTDLPPLMESEFQRLSAEGKRVIGLATRQIVGTQIDESEMTFVGLLVFEDPIKTDAMAALGELAALNIDVYIVTGDNEQVARAVANQVGIASEQVITGDVLARDSETELIEQVRTCRVFAAVDPLQKKQIVRILQKSGQTVGFFGDGINDAAALKAADVGISVDTAVDVAKGAAAIVLLDKDLAVIANGVRLGRRTFANTLKYIKVTISANFGNTISMALTSLFLPFLPLLPGQILLLNFLSDFPDLAISGDNVDEHELAQPRLWDVKEVRRFMVRFGAVSSVFDLLTFAVLIFGVNATQETFRTSWFVESTLTELAAMLMLRTALPFWRSRPSRGLALATAGLAVVVVTLPYIGLGAAVQLVPLPAGLLGTLFGLIAGYVVLNELTKARFRTLRA